MMDIISDIDSAQIARIWLSIISFKSLAIISFKKKLPENLIYKIKHSLAYASLKIAYHCRNFNDFLFIFYFRVKRKSLICRILIYSLSKDLKIKTYVKIATQKYYALFYKVISLLIVYSQDSKHDCTILLLSLSYHLIFVNNL